MTRPELANETMTAVIHGVVPMAEIADFFDPRSPSWPSCSKDKTSIADQGLTPGADLWEVYVTESSPDMDPADLRTEPFWTVR